MHEAITKLRVVSQETPVGASISTWLNFSQWTDTWHFDCNDFTTTGESIFSMVTDKDDFQDTGKYPCSL